MDGNPIPRVGGDPPIERPLKPLKRPGTPSEKRITDALSSAKNADEALQILRSPEAKAYDEYLLKLISEVEGETP